MTIHRAHLPGEAIESVELTYNDLSGVLTIEIAHAHAVEQLTTLGPPQAAPTDCIDNIRVEYPRHQDAEVNDD